MYLLKMGRLPKKNNKIKKIKKIKRRGNHVYLKRKTSNFYLRHPIGLILLVAESKEYIYIYIYVVNKWVFALR